MCPSAWSPDGRWVRLAQVLPHLGGARMAIMGKHERMTAERAYGLGLITEIVPHDRLLARAHEIADTVNRNAPLAVRGTGPAVVKAARSRRTRPRCSPRRSAKRNLHRGLTRGPAFLEKRAPNWQCR